MPTLTQEELKLVVESIVEARRPEFHSVKISDTRAWTSNYYERKHLYIYSANSFAFTAEDLGTFSVPANVLIMYPFDQGVRAFSTTASTTFTFFIIATDELLPNGIYSTTLGQSTNPEYVVVTSGPTGPNLSLGATGEINDSNGGNVTLQVSASGNVITRAGRLCKVLVNTAPSATITFYDSNNSTTAGKTPIGYVLTGDSQGSIIDIQLPCANGIYASFAGTGNITVGYD